MLITVLVLPWVAAALAGLLDGRNHGVGVLVLAVLLICGVTTAFLLGIVWRHGAQQIVTGGWPQGIGIRIQADLMGLAFTLVSTVVVTAALAHELASGIQHRLLPALALVLVAGLTGLFLTADVFNFYVFFEIAMTASLASLYTALVGHYEIADWAVGVGLGATLLWFGWLRGGRERRDRRGPAMWRAIVYMPGLVCAVFVQVVQGTWLVLRAVLGLSRLPPAGLVTIPFGGRSRAGVLITGWIVTISPGLYLVDIDWRRRCLVLHAFDASDPDGIARDLQAFYERYQRHVVP